MREEEIYEEFDADEIRRDIKDGLEGHVDDVVDYIMEELGIDNDTYIPWMYSTIREDINKLASDITTLIEIRHNLTLEPTDYIERQGRETWRWILANWQSYNLSTVKSREAMLKLLYILEFNEETLDSLHRVGTMAEYDDNEFCGVYGSFSNDSEVAECVFELFGCEVDRDAALQYTLSDAIDWRKGSEELTPEILDSIRSEFSVIMEYLYQRYDGDAVIRDYRC